MMQTDARVFEGIVSKVRTATHSGAKKLHLFRRGRKKNAFQAEKMQYFLTMLPHVRSLEDMATA